MARKGSKKVVCDWSGGNQYYYDKSGNEIFHVDGESRKIVIPSGSTLELASGSTATLVDKVLAAADLALAEGNILVGDSSGAGAAVSAKTDGRILVGNGTTVASVAVSGDATLANTGALTIANLAVTAGKLAAAVTTMINGLRTYVKDGMKNIGTITVSGGDATKFKTTTILAYLISGVSYVKAATDALVFSAANTINTAGAATTAHWGISLIQINAAGTISTVQPSADQDYATEAAAIAALPAATAGNVQIGYITVQGLASTAWTFTTSNLTVGGGAGNCTARNFYDLPAAASLPAAL